MDYPDCLGGWGQARPEMGTGVVRWALVKIRSEEENGNECRKRLSTPPYHIDRLRLKNFAYLESVCSNPRLLLSVLARSDSAERAFSENP